jgi:hypothetical protein
MTSLTRSIRQDYSAIATVQLIGGCTGGDAAAWHEFIRRFHSIIAITASRAARRWNAASPQIIDDLVEETYLTLCADHGRVLRQLRFEYAEGISDFLKIVTANVANDHFRALYGDKRGYNAASPPGDGSESNSSAYGTAQSGRHHAGRDK